MVHLKITRLQIWEKIEVFNKRTVEWYLVYSCTKLKEQKFYDKEMNEKIVGKHQFNMLQFCFVKRTRDLLVILRWGEGAQEAVYIKIAF